MEKLFIDFMGPLTRTKQGNIAILVVVDAFSKFVQFYPVRKITYQVVSDNLERGFFPAFGMPGYFAVRLSRICVFSGESTMLPPPLTTPKVRWPNVLIVT
jgi:hypothetical protein